MKQGDERCRDAVRRTVCIGNTMYDEDRTVFLCKMKIVRYYYWWRRGQNGHYCQLNIQKSQLLFHVQDGGCGARV